MLLRFPLFGVRVWDTYMARFYRKKLTKRDKGTNLRKRVLIVIRGAKQAKHNYTQNVTRP